MNLLDDTAADVATGSTLSFNNALNLNGNNLAKTGAGTLLINNALNSGGGTVTGLGFCVQDASGHRMEPGEALLPPMTQEELDSIPWR